MGDLSGILAYQNTAENKRVVPGEDSGLFWPIYTLDNFFGLRNPACDPFARSFLEPESNDPRMVRFFFRDLHYLLVAINNALLYMREDRFIGSPRDLENSSTPLERRSPNLDMNSIVRLYQMDLLTYIMRSEAEVGKNGDYKVDDCDWLTLFERPKTSPQVTGNQVVYKGKDAFLKIHNFVTLEAEMHIRKIQQVELELIMR